jgi:hypothetical protein
MIDTSIDTLALTFQVDPEHGAKRLTIVATFVIGWIIGFAVLNTLIPGTGLNIIAVLGGFAVTGGVTWVAERLLRQRWPSGRIVEIHEDMIEARKAGAVQQHIDGSKHVNVLLWRFKIKRRSRVPKGWFMVACSLEQENNYLSVYTFMSPEQVNYPQIANRFKMLLGAKEVQGNNQDLRLAGEQRRLRMAEEHRWMHGAEMSNADFEAYLVQLQKQFPKWMPSA